MATQIWVNMGSGNGLLPDGTKPLPEPMLNVNLSSVRSSDIYLRASSQDITQPSISEIIWKIKYLKFHSNFQGANELRKFVAAADEDAETELKSPQWGDLMTSTPLVNTSIMYADNTNMRNASVNSDRKSRCNPY